jgi:hypothetical protein
MTYSWENKRVSLFDVQEALVVDWKTGWSFTNKRAIMFKALLELLTLNVGRFLLLDSGSGQYTVKSRLRPLMDLSVRLLSSFGDGFKKASLVTAMNLGV